MHITSLIAVDCVITDSSVDAVVHCSAYISVDLAEDDPETCCKVNVDSTRNIALFLEN